MHTTSARSLAVHSLGVALGAFLLSAAPALGTTVKYSTTGTFSTTGTDSITGGDVTLAFTDVSDSHDLTPPTTDKLGSFKVTDPNGADFTMPSGETFTLVIDQTLPNSGNGSLGDSSITGTISNPLGAGNGKTGDYILTFDETSVTIGEVTYTLEDLGQNGLASNQLAIGTTTTTIEAAITASPEPASLALIGGGLSLLGLARWRRLATRA